MLTTHVYFNPKNNRKYILEYGDDLFGNLVISIHYGIGQGICKRYVFDSAVEQFKKVQCIKAKRIANGYYKIT